MCLFIYLGIVLAIVYREMNVLSIFLILKNLYAILENTAKFAQIRIEFLEFLRNRINLIKHDKLIDDISDELKAAKEKRNRKI